MLIIDFIKCALHSLTGHDYVYAYDNFFLIDSLPYGYP